MKNNTHLFFAALVLVLLNAAFWLVFAILMVTGLHPAPPQSLPLMWTMAGLSLIASLVLFILCVFVKKHSRWAYYLTIAVLGTLVLMTIADDFGLADLVYLALTVLPLALLLRVRKWYFDSETSVKE